MDKIEVIDLTDTTECHICFSDEVLSSEKMTCTDCKHFNICKECFNSFNNHPNTPKKCPNCRSSKGFPFTKKNTFTEESFAQLVLVMTPSSNYVISRSNHFSNYYMSEPIQQRINLYSRMIRNTEELP